MDSDYTIVGLLAAAVAALWGKTQIFDKRDRERLSKCERDREELNNRLKKVEIALAQISMKLVFKDQIFRNMEDRLISQRRRVCDDFSCAKRDNSYTKTTFERAFESTEPDNPRG